MNALLHSDFLEGMHGSFRRQRGLLNCFKPEQCPQGIVEFGCNCFVVQSQGMRRVASHLIDATIRVLKEALSDFYLLNLSQFLCGRHRNFVLFYIWARLSKMLANIERKCLTHCGGIFNNKTGFYHMKTFQLLQIAAREAGPGGPWPRESGIQPGKRD